MASKTPNWSGGLQMERIDSHQIRGLFLLKIPFNHKAQQVYLDNMKSEPKCHACILALMLKLKMVVKYDCIIRMLDIWQSSEYIAILLCELHLHQSYLRLKQNQLYYNAEITFFT